MVLIAQVYADIEQSKLRIKRKGLINQPLAIGYFDVLIRTYGCTVSPAGLHLRELYQSEMIGT